MPLIYSLMQSATLTSSENDRKGPSAGRGKANAVQIERDTNAKPKVSKGRKRAKVIFGRNLSWPKCAGCALPAEFLFQARDKRLCTQCHFMDSVQRDRQDLKNAIKALRDKGLCAYCGEFASDVEHVVPQHTGLPTFTVPSCHECNLIAGGKLFSCFDDKLQFIKNGLQDKYAKVLNSPEWDEDEIADLGYNLREKIRANEFARKVMTQRMAWAPLFVSLHAG